MAFIKCIYLLCVSLFAVTFCYKVQFTEGRQLKAFKKLKVTFANVGQTLEGSLGHLKDTTPGHSPSIGHPSESKNSISHNLKGSSNDLKAVGPGHSPGIGHGFVGNSNDPNAMVPRHSPSSIGHSFQRKTSISQESSNNLKAVELGHSPGIGHKLQNRKTMEGSLEAIVPGHSPGIGHGSQNKNTITHSSQRSFDDVKDDTTPGHSPGIGHAFQRSFDEVKDTTPGHSPGIGHSFQNKITGPNE